MMARSRSTYAIRLAVEGGGQVKAELVSVGQSGEQSLKRIGDPAERVRLAFKLFDPEGVALVSLSRLASLAPCRRSRRPAAACQGDRRPSMRCMPRAVASQERPSGLGSAGAIRSFWTMSVATR